MRGLHRQVSTLSMVLTAGLAPSALWAQEAPIEQEVAELRQRIIDIEAAQIESDEDAQIVTSSGVRLTFGGYVKVDFIYDLNQDLGDTFFVGGIDVDDSEDEPNFRAHARQTRFNLLAEGDTPLGPLVGFIEGDFFGSGGNEVFSNSSGFRLRQAYIEWNDILAGQTWTNFMPLAAYPRTVDFEGPAGIPFIRQAQLRYTYPVSENLNVSASIENAEFSGRNAEGSVSGDDQAPDFTLAAVYSDDWGTVKGAALGRLLEASGFDDSAFAWGLSLSGIVDVWEGGAINASVSGGDGIGRYIINGGGQDAFVDADGDLETITSYGATFGVTQVLTPRVEAGLTGGYYQVEDTFSPDDLEKLNTVHASLFWSPVDRLDIMGEVMWGRRENADGRSGDDVRLQGAIQVSF